MWHVRALRPHHYRVIGASLRPPSYWRRPCGRPRTSWLRAIDTDVQSVNIGIHSATQPRQHSITWRASKEKEEFKEEEEERRKMFCWRGARFCDFSVTVTAIKEGDTLIFRAWAKLYLAHPTATQQQARRVTFCWCFLFLPLILSLFFNN